MKLDYATLISPQSLYLQDIGHIIPPKLEHIWNPNITYQGYKVFLSLLLVDLQQYCEKINVQKYKWYVTLPPKEVSNYNMFDIFLDDESLRNQYEKLLNFFFEETVKWDTENCVFAVYTKSVIKETEYVNRKYNIFQKLLIKLGFLKLETHDVEVNKNDIIGVIHKEIWNELCDIILQMCGIDRSKNSEKKIKFKNKIAKEVWEILHEDENKDNDTDNELPNIISAIAAKHLSLNITNIWELTVYQLYDQFRRLQINSYYDISSMSVAAYGDSEGNFNGKAWYQNIYEN